MSLSDYAPPALLRFIHRTKRPRVCASYWEASRLCARNGYEQKDLLDVIYKKTIIFTDRIKAQKPLEMDVHSLRACFALSLSLRSESLKVIDLGGPAAPITLLRRRCSKTISS